MSEQQYNLTTFNDLLINKQGVRTHAVDHRPTRGSLEEDCKGCKL